MATLYVARHGESIWNAAQRIQGQVDVPLSDCGRRQASALAQRLAATHADVIFTSDLARARETAACVAAARTDSVPFCVRPALRERSYGSWEGRTAAEMQAWRAQSSNGKAGAGAAPEWWEGPPDGETFAATITRLLGAWEEVAGYLTAGATALLVGHAAAIRALMCGLTGTPPAAQRRWQLGNAGLACLDWQAGHLAVRYWNDCRHTAADSAEAGDGHAAVAKPVEE